MSGSRPTVADKRKVFRKLHEAGCFVIPNPWNVGTARYLQGLGFKALATTSSGHAHSPGFPDASMRRASRPANRSRRLYKAVAPRPVNFLNGWALGFTVSDIAATGVRRISVGGSLARVAMQAFIRAATEIAAEASSTALPGSSATPS